MSSVTSAGDARIVAEGLTYALPNGRVLFHDLDLAIGRERAGLIGPNGSGKTTLLLLLSGRLLPTGGSVQRTGTVAMLPQDLRPAANTPLSTALGIRERLEALRRLEAGEGEVADLETIGDEWDLEARVREELARFGLGDLPLDRPLGAVSGGQATRVGVAGLALRRPELLLLDEPTSHLDFDALESMEEALRAYAGALLVVSHDEDFLETIGIDRRIVLTLP